MADVLNRWNIIGQTKVLDVSYLPTRIQDIPKEVLRTFGLVVEEEKTQEVENDSGSDTEDGKLVIDETRPALEIVVQEISSKVFEGVLKDARNKETKLCIFEPEVSITEVVSKSKGMCQQRRATPPAVGMWEGSVYKKLMEIESSAIAASDMKKIAKRKSESSVPSSLTTSTPRLWADGSAGTCPVCKAVYPAELLHKHLKCHCSFKGCLDLLHTSVDHEKHSRIHAHPTKPMQCRYCKKRYRSYAMMERHANSTCRSNPKNRSSLG